jgi:hypothetical protein
MGIYDPAYSTMVSTYTGTFGDGDLGAMAADSAEAQEQDAPGFQEAVSDLALG